jgi:hypothetical protein
MENYDRDIPKTRLNRKRPDRNKSGVSMRNRKLRGTGTKSNAIRCTPKIRMMSRYARSLTGAKIATVSKLDFN